MSCGCSEAINMTGGKSQKSQTRLQCMTYKDLQTMLRERGVQGRSKLTTKEQMISVLAKKNKTK